MQLVFFFQAAQNRDRIFHCGLGDKDRLETTGERCVLFDMFAIFVERGGANAMQLTARQSGLEQIGRIHRTICLAGTNEGVHFINEENNAPFSCGDLSQHSLQALFKLAAIFCTRNQRAHIQRKQLLVAQALRHVFIDDAQCQTFHNGCLADAGLTDENRIVLGAT